MFSERTWPVFFALNKMGGLEGRVHYKTHPVFMAMEPTQNRHVFYNDGLLCNLSERLVVVLYRSDHFFKSLFINYICFRW